MDQAAIAKELGVTREWVSKLENVRGDFSEFIRLKIEALERKYPEQVREPTSHHVAEPAGGYGDAGAAQGKIREQLEELLFAAGGDQARLGWILEQMRAHLAPPDHWQLGSIHAEVISAGLSRERREDAALRRRAGGRDPEGAVSK
jgi:transcriptional regulator with XRE-family HTH domain